ncbi:MAG: prolyl-tRNA synthetase associated domain-containing protein [Firmicutes bacterium HGW-Firmicutes-16]|nr:MAG: prolyl-tRNA synthetase associated domain-containing protein [Firmicutes bacterium HGW-Firmicutes-16]
MDVEIGRPRDMEGRIAPEIRSYDLLERLQIEYTRVDHEKAETMEVCLERASVLGTRICKNLFLCNRQETVFYLLAMPADKQFRTSVVSAQLGVARLHFADEKHMEQFLDIRPGSVSVMGLMNDKKNNVRLLIDRDIVKQEYFACHPCINTSSLKFRTSELFEKLLPAMGHEPTFIDL